MCAAQCWVLIHQSADPALEKMQPRDQTTSMHRMQKLGPGTSLVNPDGAQMPLLPFMDPPAGGSDVSTRGSDMAPPGVPEILPTARFFEIPYQITLEDEGPGGKHGDTEARGTVEAGRVGGVPTTSRKGDTEPLLFSNTK